MSNPMTTRNVKVRIKTVGVAVRHSVPPDSATVDGSDVTMILEVPDGVSDQEAVSLYAKTADCTYLGNERCVRRPLQYSELGEGKIVM